MRFISWSCVSFNPRSRGGSDTPGFAIAYHFRFQSALPRGERPLWHAKATAPRVSIRAPAGGATKLPTYKQEYLGFNPRSRGGSDVE